MGSTDHETRRLHDVIDAAWWRSCLKSEVPPHKVEITRAVDIGTYAVTVGQFRVFVEATGYTTDGERNGRGAYRWSTERRRWDLAADCTWLTPGFQQADDHPVVCVSWNDAMAYSAWLSKREGRVVRLPTEAEWEYACRASTTTAFHAGESLESYQANFDGTDPLNPALSGPYLQRTSPVESYAPNLFGLHDMHGNVYEWCSDWLDDTYYARSPRQDPLGPPRGTERVVRGGAWNTIAARCRSACRKGGWVDFSINRRGFRILAELR